MRYTTYRYASFPRKDWGGTLTGASSGFKLGSSIGSVFGPVGSGIAGGIGALVGGIFGNSAENKAKRKLAAQQREMNLAKSKAKVEEERIAKEAIYNSDKTYLNTLQLNNANSLFMKKGGKISASGIAIGSGNKLLTKNGSTRGTHESGQNLPIKKNGRIVAIAEPGEVLVKDKSMPLTPFILSKRIGRYGTNGISFAEEYTNLENNKDKSNSKMITKRQKNLIRLNNIVADNTKFAANGTRISKDNSYSLPTVDIVGNKTSFMKTLSPGTVSNNLGIQKYTGTLPADNGKKFGKIGSTAKNIFGKLGSSDNVNTLISAAGTIGNILMTNKTLNKQRDYINANLKEALAYNPSYNKNYLLDETVDISNNVSSINQGYLHSTAGLSNIDPAIASALKNNANLSRTSALQSMYGEASRTRIGLRNQNITNIANVNRGNTDLRNQTSLMKLNAKIASNEQLADLEGARLANFQGAISELNSVMSDRAALKSMDARWKDTIGKDSRGVSKCGGKIGRRKRKLVR